jgi:hypothetical protein
VHIFQGKELFTTPDYYSGGQSAFDRNYWSYMFLDRGIYLPTDRINVWGLAKPSGGSQKLAGGVLPHAILKVIMKTQSLLNLPAAEIISRIRNRQL